MKSQRKGEEIENRNQDKEVRLVAKVPEHAMENAMTVQISIT